MIEFDSVLFISNNVQKESFWNKILYSLIKIGQKSEFNHCQLLLKISDKYYIAESTISGFCITKTKEKWDAEQEVKNRRYILKKIKNNNSSVEKRFEEILGNKYDAKYWFYLIKNILNKWEGDKCINSTNCFQSVSYIIGDENWYEADANLLMNSKNLYN